MSIQKQVLTKKELTLQNRRAFVKAGIGLALGALGLGWMIAPSETDEVPDRLRLNFEANESLWKKLSDPTKLNSATKAPPDGSPARINGDIGLEEDINLSDWQLEYESPNVKKTLTIDDLKKIPRTKSESEFRCIEGWSMPIGYEGIKFSDFLNSVDPAGIHFPYVGLETPDADYYVGLDMPSMLHAQTLLADHMNGSPLGKEHGEPLRLIIPVKYGIKNIKRIGRIFLSNEKPADYWAENGYDWYSGL